MMDKTWTSSLRREGDGSIDIHGILSEVRKSGIEARWHWIKSFLEAEVFAILEFPADGPARERFSDPPGGWSRSLVRAYRETCILHPVRPQDETAHHQGLKYVLLIPLTTDTLVYLGWTGEPDRALMERMRIFMIFLEVWCRSGMTARDTRDVFRSRLELEKYAPGTRSLRLESGDVLVWRSNTYHQVILDLFDLAGEDVSVLLTGETGVGKTVLARFLHESSPRKEGPFVHFVVPTIPSELFASNLFGAVRGAYTDAVCDRMGFIAMAEGGTLFLDEIADIPSMTQATLLNVIERGVYTVVGDTRQRTCDVRWVSATNRMTDIRSDLVFRLGEEWIHIPPLRERPEDILPIFLMFSNMPVDKGVEDLLLSYPWPGNQRELIHTARTIARRARRRRMDIIEVSLVKEELERRRWLN